MTSLPGAGAHPALPSLTHPGSAHLPNHRGHIMKKSSTGVVVLTLAFAGAAFAQNANSPRSDSDSDNKVEMTKNSFVTVDTNKDGRISQSEARTHGATLGTSFAMLDADKDTYLSQTEFGKWKSGSSQGATSPSDSSRMPADGSSRSPDGNSPAGQPRGDAGSRDGTAPQSTGGSR